MIKSMYVTSYKTNDGVKREYDIVLEDCKNYIRDKSELTRSLTGEDFNNKIRDIIYIYLDEKKVYTEEMVQGEEVNIERLVLRLYSDINQYGPITESLANQAITDIYCEGVGPGNLYVMKGRTHEVVKDANGKVLYFKTPDEITSVINKLAFSFKTRINQANPIMYAQTIHGYRLTATDSSISADVVMSDGTKLKVPTFSIRIGAKADLSLEDMVYTHKTIHPEIAKILSIIGRLEHIKILFSGVPGTGKTTLMVELIKEIKDKRILTIERTPEISLWKYDENGNSTNRIKSVVATKDTDTTGNMAIPTIRNLYFMSLREKVDILVLGEIRSGEEISVMLEAAISGQGVMSTIHGEDEETTMERLVKDIGAVKNASRSEAMEEAYLSVNLVVNMYLDSIDKQIRVRSIAEVVKEETSIGIRVKSNRLFEFHKYGRGINPATGRVYGYYRKVGVPSERLKRYIADTDITEEEEEILMREASLDNPVNFSEAW